MWWSLYIIENWTVRIVKKNTSVKNLFKSIWLIFESKITSTYLLFYSSPIKKTVDSSGSFNFKTQSPDKHYDLNYQKVYITPLVVICMVPKVPLLERWTIAGPFLIITKIYETLKVLWEIKLITYINKSYIALLIAGNRYRTLLG